MNDLTIILIIFGILILAGIIGFIIYWFNRPKTCQTVQPPTNVTAVLNQEAGSVLVNWTASPDATSYNIYAGNKPEFDTSDSTFLVGNVIGVTTFTYSLIGGGGDYYFKVKSLQRTDTLLCPSEAVPSPGILIRYKGNPLCPNVIPSVTNVKVNSTTNPRTISWTPISDLSQADGYNIYRGTSPDFPTISDNFIGDVKRSNISSFNLPSTPPPNGTYYLKVVSYKSVNNFLCFSGAVPTGGVTIIYT